VRKRSARIDPGPGKLPKLQSADEERRFCDEHNPVDWIEGPGDLITRLKRRQRKQITIRMDEPLYSELRAVADGHGVPYPRLMRELLRQALSALRARERRAARRRSGAQGRGLAGAPRRHAARRVQMREAWRAFVG
jgi:hypothetical protein